MNQSPKNLGESIRLMNSDFSYFNVIEYENCHYVTESSIASFMEDNNLSDRDNIVEQIKVFNGINEITLLDESTTDENLIFAKEIISLYESLNPLEVARVAKGRSLLRSSMDQIAGLVSKNKNYEEDQLSKYIKHCDKMLKDIEEERNKIKEHKADDHVKFSMMYAFNIAKNLFMIFVLPQIISKKIKWPPAIVKLFTGKASPEKLVKLAKAKKAVEITATTLDVIATLPPDLEGLYMSFKDYDGLLMDYENQIKNMKREFVQQKAKIERKKEMNLGMVKFNEDCTSCDAVEVHYQTPEELQSVDHAPEVVHDDTKPAEVPAAHSEPEVQPPVAAPEMKEIPNEIHPDAPVTPADFSPLDAIKQAQADPQNVPIAKYNDRYYIDHNDLKCYMDACGETKYENALNNIIRAHESTELSAENVRVIMGENDISNLDSGAKLAMESSQVQFEVYSTKK